MTGSKSRIINLPLPQDDPAQRKPDITLAKKTLNGWTATIPLENGLERTIEYFKKELNT
jgi:UDP-glucuronate decarboxylase